MESLYDLLPKIQSTGEILSDGRSRWQDLKLRSRAISSVLGDSNQSEKRSIARSTRMFECAETLRFLLNNAGERRLFRAYFCKDRMCPMCQKRRSLIIFHNVKNVCSEIEKNNPSFKFVLLTLTVPNVPIEELPSKITDMNKAWNKLIKRKKLSSVCGWFKTLEVTYNAERDDYHPHFHVLLCVNHAFFGKNYIPHDDWVSLWQKSMKDFSITQVDIRKIKPNKKREGSSSLSAAAAEVAKYATKPSDYLLKIPSKIRYFAVSKVINELSGAIANRKLVSFGGMMLDYSIALKNANVESAEVDLINTGDNESDQIIAISTQIFRWNVGLNNYVC